MLSPQSLSGASLHNLTISTEGGGGLDKKVSSAAKYTFTWEPATFVSMLILSMYMNSTLKDKQKLFDK
jgi:hypothetical protein